MKTGRERTHEIMLRCRDEGRALTFDDVTFQDKPSELHPNQVTLETHITKKIKLRGCGIMAAAMDTVTEKELAYALAKMGGIGIIHRNMTPGRQAAQVKWVRNKIHDGGMINKPITYFADQTLADLQKDRAQNGWTFTNFPILDRDNKLVGMVSRNEMEFVVDTNPVLEQIMIPLKKTIYVNKVNKTSIKEAHDIMKEHKVKKLPAIDEEGHFIGLYTWKDVVQDENKKNFFSLDEEGHFLVGAAVGIGPEECCRVDELIKVGCKLIVIDTSHGACKPAVDMVEYIKTVYSDQTEVMLGNIASQESMQYVMSQKYVPEAIKCGISAGSICTTRLVTGHGMPQLTSIFEVADGCPVPVIADGGMRYSSDVVKALAMGASGVMFGNIFAGTDESPGRLVIDGGQKYKVVRGMGSRSAMEERAGSRNRYFGTAKTKVDSVTQQQMQKLVPEGVEAFTKYRGSVEQVMNEFLGGIRSGLAHSGAKNIEEFKEKATMWIQSPAGTAEGNPHSLTKILG